MSYQLIFDNKAVKEFLKSFAWYEDQQEGLGSRFENAVYERLNEIQQHPEHYTQKKKPYKEIMIKKFPFLIITNFIKLIIKFSSHLSFTQAEIQNLNTRILNN